MMLGANFVLLLVAAFVIGGTTNPLYSLLIAHTNDFLAPEDMAAASGGLVFINGLGAIAGPLITGWLMEDNVFGPMGYFLLLVILLFAIAGYAAWRATRRPGVPVEDTGAMSPMSPAGSPIAVEFAQEVAIEAGRDDQSAA
jgi:MFS family permease